MNSINYKEVYNSGKLALQKKDYISARYYFNIVKENPKYNTNANLYLAEIEIREGKYQKARELLNQITCVTDLDNVFYNQTLGLLEKVEYNYTASKNAYQECLKNPNFQVQGLFSLASLNIQTKNNEIARKMYETLTFVDEKKYSALIELIYLEILEQNYDKAYELLREIDQEELTNVLYNRCSILNNFLLHKQKKLDKSTIDYLSNGNSYTTKRFLKDDDLDLLEHIKSHKDQDKRYTEGCFLKYIDLKELLTDVREKIQKLNPAHHGLSNNYIVDLEEVIGYKEDELTSCVRTTTIIGTDIILTMYPVCISDKFDIEGNLNNSKLIRTLGGSKK